jgi:aspartate carbamoyltransferase catalytic subunit
VKAYTSLREALEGADVVMALRIQNERLEGAFFPSVREYSATYGIDRAKLHLCEGRRDRDAPGPDQPRRRALARSRRPQARA